MGVKKLIGLAVPVMMLFSGCGVYSKASKETKAEVKENHIQKIKVSEEDYPQYVVDLGEELDKEFKGFADIATGYYNGNKTNKDVLNGIERFNKVTDKFLAIDPPSKYVDQQKVIEKAMAKYKKAFSLIKDVRTGKKSSPKEDGKTAYQLTEEGDEYWGVVHKELKNELTKSK